MLNFATALKQELQDTRISVSAGCPGIVATELRANAEAARPDALKETIAPPPLLTKTRMAYILLERLLARRSSPINFLRIYSD
ncbi:MAG: hypothetical protein JO303_14670 [Caulobacteraceae bacterium]|nr:hypothetical protein [Caulobacteraceae bacterium]